MADLCLEYIPNMKSWRAYSSEDPQSAVAYLDRKDLDTINDRAKEEGYDSVILRDVDTMQVHAAEQAKPAGADIYLCYDMSMDAYDAQSRDEDFGYVKQDDLEAFETFAKRHGYGNTVLYDRDTMQRMDMGKEKRQVAWKTMDLPDYDDKRIASSISGVRYEYGAFRVSTCIYDITPYYAEWDKNREYPQYRAAPGSEKTELVPVGTKFFAGGMDVNGKPIEREVHDTEDVVSYLLATQPERIFGFCIQHDSPEGDIRTSVTPDAVFQDEKASMETYVGQQLYKRSGMSSPHDLLDNADGRIIYACRMARSHVVTIPERIQERAKERLREAIGAANERNEENERDEMGKGMSNDDPSYER